jgi:hypothetical protein
MIESFLTKPFSQVLGINFSSNRTRINTGNKLSIEQIEGIEFEQVGGYPYKLKRVEIHSELQNISGLTRIGRTYYKKVY